MASDASIDIKVTTKFHIVKIKRFPRARRHVIIEDANGKRITGIEGDSIDLTQSVRYKTGIYDR